MACVLPLPGPRIRGIVWMLAAVGFFTASMIIVRGLSQHVHIFEIVFFRALFGVAVMLPWLARAGTGVLHTRRIGLYSVRSGLATANLAVIFYALALMPVADVTAILFTRPIFTTILALYVLGELAGGRQWRALAVGFAGALLIIRPGFDAVNEGALLALASAVMTAVLFTIAKALTRTEPVDAIAFYQAFLMLPFAALPAVFVWQTPTWEQLFWMFAIGGLATLSHRAMNRAYALSDLTLLQPLEFARLPFAAALGFAFFGESPDAWVWIGGAVIFAASFYGTRPAATPKPRSEPA